jgi:hypothetical protein
MVTEGVNQTQPTKASRAFGYFALSYCSLVVTVGTFTLFLLLGHLSDMHHPILLFTSASGVYFSSAILGVLGLPGFWRIPGRELFWYLMIGIVLNVIFGFLALGLCILCFMPAFTTC